MQFSKHWVGQNIYLAFPVKSEFGYQLSISSSQILLEIVQVLFHKYYTNTGLILTAFL